MDAEGRREGTIEVTTDNTAKRALPVEAAAWQGWLYSGGHAPLCSPQVGLTNLLSRLRLNFSLAPVLPPCLVIPLPCPNILWNPGTPTPTPVSRLSQASCTQQPRVIGRHLHKG